MRWMDRKIHQAGVTAVLPISPTSVSSILTFFAEVNSASFHIAYRSFDIYIEWLSAIDWILR
jgi:hypothetical protein